MNNFIIRSITGIIFVVAIVASFLRPEAMVLLFSIVTGLTVWEFTGLVNDRPGVTVNRFICTVAAVYFFYAMTYFCSDLYGGAAKSVVFIPYLVTIIYLLVAELYLKQEDPIEDWAYTMLSQMYIALLAAQRAGIHRHVSGHGKLQHPVAAVGIHIPLGKRHRSLLCRLTTGSPQAVPPHFAGQVMGGQHRRSSLRTCSSMGHRLVRQSPFNRRQQYPGIINGNALYS